MFSSTIPSTISVSGGSASGCSLPRRCDLTRPAAVFGGVFLAAIAICGTLDAVTPVVSAAEDHTLTEENVIGPEGIDPLALACDQNHRGKGIREVQKNCEKRDTASQN